MVAYAGIVKDKLRELEQRHRTGRGGTGMGIGGVVSDPRAAGIAQDFARANIPVPGVYADYANSGGIGGIGATGKGGGGGGGSTVVSNWLDLFQRTERRANRPAGKLSVNEAFSNRPIQGYFLSSEGREAVLNNNLSSSTSTGKYFGIAPQLNKGNI